MIRTYERVLTNDECEKFINEIDTKQGKIAFTNSGIFENDKYTDKHLADFLFSRIYNQDSSLQNCRAHDLIITGKYNVGNSFGLHVDTGIYYNRKENERSRYTLLIYLNQDFEGGDTEFYDEQFNKIKTVIPETGKALLFDIDLWHKGNEILLGNKYWIGCEIIGKF